MSLPHSRPEKKAKLVLMLNWATKPFVPASWCGASRMDEDRAAFLVEWAKWRLCRSVDEGQAGSLSIAKPHIGLCKQNNGPIALSAFLSRRQQKSPQSLTQHGTSSSCRGRSRSRGSSFCTPLVSKALQTQTCLPMVLLLSLQI